MVRFGNGNALYGVAGGVHLLPKDECGMEKRRDRTWPLNRKQSVRISHALVKLRRGKSIAVRLAKMRAAKRSRSLANLTTRHARSRCRPADQHHYESGSVKAPGCDSGA